MDIEFISVENMGINHGSPYILMTQQLLDRANIVPILQKMRGKRMPESMAGGILVYL